jgi:8-oxo-dGTP diphosphatase
MHWRNAKPCAGGLVVRDELLLLIRRAREPWAGYWDIPGGFCEADEHPADAAVREVREETGLAVRVTGFIGMWLDRYDDRPDGLPDTILGCYFHAEPIDGRDVVIDPVEVIEAGWFPAAKLPPEIAFPDHAWPVLDAWRAGHGR